MIPDVPGQVFTSTEYHTTFAVASALKSFCRCGTITLVNTSVWSRCKASTEKRSRIVMGDESHIVNRRERRMRVNRGN